MTSQVIETIIPGSEREWLDARTHDVTSTEAAALFGLSPYTTPFEMWHRKKSAKTLTFEPGERMRWGTRLQDSIAAGLAEDNGFAIRQMNEYLRVPELRMGSSFDYRILSNKDIPAGSADGFVNADTESDGLFEIKNVDSLAFKEGWIEDGDNLEAPPHIEIQVQHQLAVSGLGFAKIGALVGGNRGVIINRVRDEKIIAAIRSKIAEFWRSIDADIEPRPDFTRDADFIAKLHSYAEPNKVADMSEDSELEALCRSYRNACDSEKVASDSKRSLKAQILIKVGDAEKAIGNGFSVSVGMIGPTRVEAFDKAGYRNFRVNWKKEKN